MTQPNEQTAVVEKRDQAVEDAVVELLNVAVILEKDKRGRLVTKCKMCGWQDDNHATNCPVPALEEWLNPSTPD
jgi:hypothetical protein